MRYGGSRPIASRITDCMHCGRSRPIASRITDCMRYGRSRLIASVCVTVGVGL